MTTTNKRTPDITTDIFGSVLTFTFSTGETFSLDASTLAPEIQTQAMLHGLKQKISDAAAIARNTETGASATIADKFEAAKEVYTRLTSATPTWNKMRGDGESAQGGLLARALCQMSGKTPAEIADFLATKDNKQKAALRGDPKVAKVILKLQAASGKGIDTASLLAELA